MKLSTLLLLAIVIAAVFFGAKYYVDSSRRVREEADRVERGFLQTRKEYNDKLEHIRQRREEIQVQMVRLEERYQEQVDKLKKLGVEKADDLEKIDGAELAFNGARKIREDIAKYRNDVALYDRTIGRIEAALAEIDRQELLNNAGISEEDARQLDTIIRDVDDRLMPPATPLEELNQQEILDEILGDGAK